jgi:DNA-binding transcriptional LysR family regulator
MELRHLRYFAAVGEDQHYGRAAERLGIAQPALSRQIQDLEKELGFTLFDRLPRGVKLSAAGKLFLGDARRILQEVQEARLRAERVATGKAGTLRLGFIESLSWHGVVPDSFRVFRRRQPDAELELHPMLSNQQMEAVRSGKLDAGFIFSPEAPDGDVGQLQVARYKLMLAAPQGHPVTRGKQLRLRDLRDAPFIWFHRWVNPVYYDRIMHTCVQGGLTAPRIVQHAVDHATILSLVSCRLGVAFVSETTRWQRPRGVTLLPVIDLDFPVAFYLIWRKDDPSPLLERFVAQVESMLRPSSGTTTTHLTPLA